MRLFLGKLEPSSGEVRLRTNLEVPCYEQLRAGLELEKTVIENLAEWHVYVDVQGERRRLLAICRIFVQS